MAVQARSKELCKQLGVDWQTVRDSEATASDLLPFTFEVYHPRRRVYFISAPSESEQFDWIVVRRRGGGSGGLPVRRSRGRHAHRLRWQIFKECCYCASGSAAATACGPLRIVRRP